MVVSSIFSFGIFLYVQSKKIKYIFIGLLLSSFIHAIYNTSFIFSPIILLIILSYYSKMIQSLLNISPFYEKSKEKFVGESTNFLFVIIFSILILSFLFDLFFNGFKSIINNFSLFIPTGNPLFHLQNIKFKISFAKRKIFDFRKEKKLQRNNKRSTGNYS